MRLALLACAALAAASGQSLQIYSELSRIGPSGEVVAPDAAGRPREILSPAVARNAWASFHLACTVPEGTPSFLYIQQNPELFEVKAYREVFARTARGWIPDALEAVALPYTILLPDPAAPIPGQNTVVFWLDIRVPAQAPPGRMRLQAVMKSGDRWLVYPMEIRVMRATVPAAPPADGRLPGVAERSDAAVLGVLRGRLCGDGRPRGSPKPSVRAFIQRNAWQNAALLASAKASHVWETLGLGTARRWCATGAAPPLGSGPEWYLTLRDRVLRAASAP